MNVTCPKCETTYRVDPAKVPSGGVRARCTECGEVIDVRPAVSDSREGAERPEPVAATAAVGSERGLEAEPAAEGSLAGGARTGEPSVGVAEEGTEQDEPHADAGSAGAGAIDERDEIRGPSGTSGAADVGSDAGSAPAEPTGRAAASAGGAGAPTGESETGGVGEQAPPAPRMPRSAPVFGATDPDAKARRLARALISDIVVYHPERRERSIESGSLRQEFREEIQKSWEEYVAQVGDATARGTTHFRDALNEILAGGRRVF